VRTAPWAVFSTDMWTLRQPASVTSAAVYTLWLLARRILELTEEIHDLIHPITEHCPRLLTHRGISPDTAAALLITAGDTPTDCTARPPLPPGAVSTPCKHPRAKPPSPAHVAAATPKPTPRSTASPYRDCAGTSVPAATSPVASPEAKPIAKPFAA